MAPVAVLSNITSSTVKINTTTNNTLSTYIANTSVVNSVFCFGKFQDTAIGSELTSRKVVPPNISIELYRKAMIAILFFRHILSLSSSLSVTISDLTETVAAYFVMPTGSVEREAERIVELVRYAFFVVGNFQGIGCLDSSGKPIAVLDNHAADITFFSFRSTVLVRTIDQRFPSTALSLDFSLRLPQSIMSTVFTPAPSLTSGIRTPPSTPKPTMMQIPTSRSTSTFALDNATDDELNSMNATQLCQFILNARLSPYPASGVTTQSVNLLPSFSSLISSSTPKMDRVRKSVTSIGVTTYPRLPG